MSENKPKHILLAEDSLEGILSAVSYAYKSRYGHKNNKIMIAGEEGTMELFSEYIDVPLDTDAAYEVYKAIRGKLGLEFLELIEYCALSDFDDRAEVIYRSLILGFANNKDILNYRKAECIARLNKIYVNITNEINHWREFIRFKIHDLDELGSDGKADSFFEQNDKTLPVFSESKNYTSLSEYRKIAARQFLTAIIEPRHRLLTLILPYFADRYPSENFLIYDKTHDEAAIHPSGSEWYILQQAAETQPELLSIIMSDNDENAQMEDLWKIFYDTTFIKERENRKLQRSLMPLRFRGDMVEVKGRER